MAAKSQLSKGAFLSNSNMNSRQCWYITVVESLSKEDVEVLDDALADKAVSNPAIAKVLSEVLGFKRSANSIAAHRNGSCQCSKG